MAEKRKGLMSILADYQREEKQKREYSAKKKPNLSKKAASAKSNTKAAYSGKSLMPKTAKPTSGGKTKTAPPKPIPQQKKVEKKKPEAQKGNGDGTYGKSMPSNPKVGITMAPRKKRPGTGRTGEAAAKAGTRVQGKPKTQHKETMTAAKRRAMRLRARRGR